MNPFLSTTLNASRWISAFFVVLFHVRELALAGYSEIANPSLLHKAIYFLAGFGHEAVIVFFVISGFLIGGVNVERWKLRSSLGVDAVKEYSIHRIARIYVVLVPALVLGFVLDSIGAAKFDQLGLYS